MIFCFCVSSGCSTHLQWRVDICCSKDPFLVCLVFGGVGNYNCFIHVSIYNRDLLVINGFVNFRGRFIQCGDVDPFIKAGFFKTV